MISENNISIFKKIILITTVVVLVLLAGIFGGKGLFNILGVIYPHYFLASTNYGDNYTGVSGGTNDTGVSGGTNDTGVSGGSNVENHWTCINKVCVEFYGPGQNEEACKGGCTAVEPPVGLHYDCYQSKEGVKTCEATSAAQGSGNLGTGPWPGKALLGQWPSRVLCEENCKVETKSPPPAVHYSCINRGCMEFNGPGPEISECGAICNSKHYSCMGIGPITSGTNLKCQQFSGPGPQESECESICH